MDDEWVPNGCSLGAPFTVLVRKLFFMFSEELGFEIICKDTQKKMNYPNFGSRKCNFSLKLLHISEKSSIFAAELHTCNQQGK